MPSARTTRRIEGCTLEAVADLDNLYVAVTALPLAFAGNRACSDTHDTRSSKHHEGAARPLSRVPTSGAASSSFALVRARQASSHLLYPTSRSASYRSLLSRHALAPAIWLTLTEG